MNRPLRMIAAGLLIGLGAQTALAPAAFAQSAQPAAPAPAVKAPAPAALAPQTTPAKTDAAKPAAKTETHAAKGDLIDINAATADQLDALKGIGKARAEAIVKGRPYKGKDELVQKKIIPQSVYDDIKDKIVAHQK